jgi:glycosyltransferase involved in cell wall biosynthesis
MIFANRWHSPLQARLHTSPLSAVASAAFRCFQKTLRRLNSPDRKVVSLKPPGSPQGHLLISHLIEPWIVKPDHPLLHSHTRYWEAVQIVKTFLELGYDVDIISFDNHTFIPRRKYDVFIGSRFNFERMVPLLNEDCTKILHGETAHILFHNVAESKRLLDLYMRRGVVLRSRRWERPNKATEYADYITIFGNAVTLMTYRQTKKPIYPLPVTTTVLLPWAEHKDFEACRRQFLWFGSGGMVHKGLDLVLEAFAGMPEYQLIVCGPVQKEHDFEQAFYEELYKTPNIHTYGWIDTRSMEFREITGRCVGLIYPSCSEGQAGAVVECLHAGLIPIISDASGIDVDDFGLILKTCTIEEIREAVQRVAAMPIQEMRRMARSAWEFARANHTRERFAEEYRKVIAHIMAHRATMTSTQADNQPNL